MPLFKEPYPGVDTRMQCPECQTECQPEAAFCQSCGFRLVEAEEEPSAQPEPPVESAVAEPARSTPHDQFREQAASAHSDEDDQEDELWTGSFSKKGMIGQWIMAGAGTLLALIVALTVGNILLATLGFVALVWVLLFAWYGYKRLSVHYTLTTQRLIHESGILWRTIDRIELIDIDDVTFKQGPVERVFKVGAIIVISGDKTSPELKLPGIDQVRRVADEIDDARRKERRRRGLHMITQGAS